MLVALSFFMMLAKPAMTLAGHQHHIDAAAAEGIKKRWIHIWRKSPCNSIFLPQQVMVIDPYTLLTSLYHIDDQQEKHDPNNHFLSKKITRKRKKN